MTPFSNKKHQSLSTHVSVGNIRCLKLQGNNESNNYNLWKEQMLCLLESQDLLGFIDGKIMKPESSSEYAEWRRIDRLVKAWILSSLTVDVMSIVVDSNTARDTWTQLETGFSKPEVETSSAPEDTGTGKDFNHYLELYRAALRSDWKMAERILIDDRDAAKARINTSLQTALHIAVMAKKPYNFVVKLLDFMTNESLAYQDHLGITALHNAAKAGNTEIANILVMRNPSLLYIKRIDNRYPVHEAAQSAKRDTLVYLLSVTTEPAPYIGEDGLYLLNLIMLANFFDLAVDLVNKYPYLARVHTKDIAPALTMIAGKVSAAFRSGRSVSFWERYIYNVPQMKKSIYDKRQDATRLVDCLLKNMVTLTQPEAFAIFYSAILLAAYQGTEEVIDMIVDTFPAAIHCHLEKTNHHIFHIAVKNRCEEVYNLVYRMGPQKNYFADLWDKDQNSLLHLCASLAPTHKLNLVSGAALQMQRELQWYKEIEKFVPPYAREQENNAGKTPRVIFTEEHRELKIEGEKWMRDTANSCILAATLIATVVFAAAITVPGGNQQETGVPIFSKQAAFIIFAVSDAISLFTSMTSLLLFLSLLTSRYAEEDFLYLLPKRLSIGLLALFLSITFMMVAFSATLYLVFGNKKAWVLIPVSALACLPVTSFVLLQFPLLVDVISSTYGPGIFGKKSDKPFF